ncbi:LytR/AlgR family response regulator transcription factor [Chryseobacterium sp.]|uniref:LytR/AlgR family response regulator transcription factor n=1 Tax=Chryseobacterium sp. TaxID=1871047 RepID=UPI00388D45BD
MSTTIKCVILDDELLALSYLKLLCEQIDNIAVVKVFNNPLVFVKEIDKLDFDVCILDIEMPGMTGLQVAELFSSSKKIIFTTAYKEYAAEAYDLNVVDYVRKPIKIERLQQAFEKIKLINTPSQKQDYIELNTNFGKTTIITDQIVYIKTSEIDSRDKEILLRDNTTLILKNISFKTLMDLLSPHRWIQVNKKEIIALCCIKVFSHQEIITTLPINKDYFRKIQIGDAYRSSLQKAFESL